MISLSLINTWYVSAHKGLFTVTLVLQLVGVNHGVSLVDHVVAVEATVVRHSRFPKDVVFFFHILIFFTFFLHICIFVITYRKGSACVPTNTNIYWKGDITCSLVIYSRHWQHEDCWEEKSDFPDDGYLFPILSKQYLPGKAVMVSTGTSSASKHVKSWWGTLRQIIHDLIARRYRNYHGRYGYDAREEESTVKRQRETRINDKDIANDWEL